MLRIALIALLGLSGCTALAPDLPNRQILFGSSFASTDEAVQELRLAVNNAESLGCRMISVGGGTGLGGGMEEGPIAGGKQIDVYALVACPAGTPVMLANTGIVP